MKQTIRTEPAVFLVCTGLGNINRGYESFFQECFQALKNNNGFDLYLIKGGGKARKKEIVIPNFSRKKILAKYFGKLLGRNAYHTEQISFCICLLPLLFRKKPALIYYSDFITGTYLWHLRKRFKFSYKLLFANGAPNGPPYKTEDHVQQLLPIYYDIGVKCDGNKKHTCLPYAFDINIDKQINGLQHRDVIKEQLGLPLNKKIILSVGAINMHHKRMDYLINEVASLSEDYFLIMLGEYDNETDDVVTLANRKLAGRYLIKNVAHKEVKQYYIAADYFALASLQEGFPRVTVEALSYGLPCIVHDYIVMRQLLKKHGIYADMRFEGQLAKCVQAINAGNFCRDELIQAAYDNYSWNKLKPKYAELITRVCCNDKKNVLNLNPPVTC